MNNIQKKRHIDNDCGNIFTFTLDNNYNTPHTDSDGNNIPNVNRYVVNANVDEDIFLIEVKIYYGPDTQVDANSYTNDIYFSIANLTEQNYIYGNSIFINDGYIKFLMGIPGTGGNPFIISGDNIDIYEIFLQDSLIVSFNDIIVSDTAAQTLCGTFILDGETANETESNEGEENTAGVAGDPHVLTFGGNKCELPHKAEIYNFLTTEDFILNVNTHMVDNKAFVENFYLKYKDSSITVNIKSLEIIDELNNNFDFIQLGPCTKQIITNDKKYNIFISSEKNAIMLKSKNNLTQENSTGVLMSDYFDECTLDRLN